MSLMVGSRSSGSSGPSPKTSSIDVAEDDLALRHAERRAFLGDEVEQQRANLRFGARPIRVGERLEIQAVEELPVNVRLELDVLRPRRLDARGAGRSGGSGRCGKQQTHDD